MSLGATEFMTKPFSPKKLLLRAAELTGVSAEMAGRADAVTAWAVILAGGVGSRFWPLSTPDHAQAASSPRDDQPLLVDTLERMAPLARARRGR